VFPVRHEPGWGRDRDREIAGSGRLGARVVEQRQGDSGVLDDGLRERGPARLLEEEDEVEGIATEAAVSLGREHAENAELAES
jgi:hypothetical protein